ncbi:CPBP family intramembrane metalloprotease [Paenalkalicoccus suaedae]|uniref:CPBP family intramembrane metalloprotease n=1 Tax=Paenalkalicoccus suaedae TaxID=2592382 RepID=A0A859FDF8_9BACI|nr:CPBP family intramembrane glutamic endopeptidase [Paenalkalicoccus suaedae]QKS71249.1 CPBP family intramembrane metalloprotease [Paenalkalicoccus suaedae]
MHQHIRKPWRAFLFYLLVGLLGILTLYPMLIDVLPDQLDTLGVESPLPIEALALASLVNPLLLLIVALIVGHFLSHRVGLHSFVYDKDRYGKPFLSRFISTLTFSIPLGILVGILILILDYAFQPFLPDVLHLTNNATFSFADVSQRLLYGGIVEELLLRFGLMTLLVFLLWKLFARKQTRPTAIIMWVSITLAALLFGLGHYSATALVTDVTPLIFIRMILLNGLGGMIYGFLFWKKGLESAMVAHMMTHVTFLVAILIT